jgi:hypothetical protein
MCRTRTQWRGSKSLLRILTRTSRSPGVVVYIPYHLSILRAILVSHYSNWWIPEAVPAAYLEQPGGWKWLAGE